MSPKAAGRRAPCTVPDAKARLRDAEAFLEAAEVDKTLAGSLRRALDRKNQAAYEARDIADADAQACVRQATMLVEAARKRVTAI